YGFGPGTGDEGLRTSHGVQPVVLKVSVEIAGRRFVRGYRQGMRRVLLILKKCGAGGIRFRRRNSPKLSLRVPLVKVTARMVRGGVSPPAWTTLAVGLYATRKSKLASSTPPYSSGKWQRLRPRPDVPGPPTPASPRLRAGR